MGDVVELNCTTGASNPAAVTRWMVDGHELRSNRSDLQVPDGENGWRTSSSVGITITNRTSIVVICRGENKMLNENVVASHTINVLCK